jgi:hypothetical protein
MTSAVSRLLRRGLTGGMWLLTTWSFHASAQETASDDARVLFHRAIELVDAGRFEEALIEFEHAYALKPRASVLYNMGMAETAARRPAEALSTFERYLKAAETDPNLPRLGEVRALVAKLRAEVGSLELKASPPSARLRLDGRAVAPGTLVLNPGSHTLAAWAPGYAETERTLVVVAGDAKTLDLTLARNAEPAAAGSSFVAVTCPLAAVEIALDGHVVANTPVRRPIVAEPGPHKLTLRRAGYLPRDVSFTAAAHDLTQVDCDLVPNPGPRPDESGLLRVRLPTDDADIMLDDRPFTGNGRVPRGPHWLSVARAGFEPWSSPITIEPTKTLDLVPPLRPTPATLRDAERAQSRRLWLTASTAGAGLVLTGTTVGLLIDNSARHRAWQREQAALDELWRTANSPASEPSARQAQNDKVGSRITLQDQVAVGIAVASAACFIVSAVSWFTAAKPRGVALQASVTRQQADGAFSFTW